MPISITRLSTWIAAAAVLLGAFGAHAIRGWASADQLEIWKTAVTYHFGHALALLLLSLWIDRNPTRARHARWIARGFTFGILLFSGSLYAMVLSGERWLGVITPLGGICLIASWIAWGVVAKNDQR